ncbi:DNA topoisomerase IV subunit A [Parvularcula sp. ZS-1/3]|uniref:DNA topoisomerase 4 subunit A n=1 Tax=Parvularcula mediterranea TaxID=2732508 RepID=A0A7Y3RML3_9PROT|nr:DNA topoisomerase IV subunit A [Parvularcula mediterranea]NNU16395.1 DNA topoisomerase IV subunit A [Parvularcula mediterranea]
MARRPSAKKNAPPPPEKIFDEPITEALAQRYLAYALSTITARALPDVRDGLKPVHRRILYAMRSMRLLPSGGYKKSAKIVGEVMGNFHPHGDQAIYDALVRLVQDFSVRVPLVDGQGNFGNVDGDNAAAMRYTESRMTHAAELLLEGIDEDAVDFRDTYDGEGKEPAVLPAAFPHLLANGAAGIAVGMATSIPPHNPSELIDAAVHLIKTPNARTETLLKYVQGPDFPTGGVCIEPRESLVEAYETGRGGFRLRAKWHTEDLGRGKYQIVVTEVPYQVQKARLVERIAELINGKKLPIITDVRDESAEDVRLILEPRAGTLDPDQVMSAVFKITDLETRFPLNMNVLDAEGSPRVMGLKEVLAAFVDHRRDVLVRRTNHRLDKIAHRLEILGGYLIAYLNLDEVIRIIRYEDHPKEQLIETFDLSEVQAEAILNMRLRALRKLEEMEIKKENTALKKEQKELRALLKSPELQDKAMTEALREVKKHFSGKDGLGKRRTEMSDAPVEVDISLDDLVEKEPVTVVISAKGWVRTLKGHTEDPATIKYKEGDRARFVLNAMSNDKLTLFSTSGKSYTLAVADLPGGRGQGEPIRILVDMASGDEPLTLLKQEEGRTFLLASSAGHGLFVEEKDVSANTRKGKQLLNLAAGAEMVVARVLPATPTDKDYVASVTSNRKLLIFPASELPTMTRGKGVILQKSARASLVDAKLVQPSEGFTWKDRAGREQSESKWKSWQGKRGGAGTAVPKGFPKNLKLGS